MGGCIHSCYNTIGSFTCDCMPGYTLSDSDSTCSGERERERERESSLLTCYLHNPFFNVSIMLHDVIFQISTSVSQVMVVVGIIVQTQWGPLSAPVCQAMLWLWMVSHVLVSSVKRLRVIIACAP